jgi:hypothetical protein
VSRPESHWPFRRRIARVDALMEDERAGLGAFSEVEIHNWEFGGRR